jgi:hypothetical protein
MSQFAPGGERVVKRMAPRNAVDGANALDIVGGKAKRQRRVGRIPKDTMAHSGRHPGFKAVARKIARKEGVPVERASAILAASSRKRLVGGGMDVMGRVLASMPTESQVFGNKHAADRTRRATVTDVPDLKTDQVLRHALAMMQANSPLDPENRERVGTGTILKHMGRALRMPRLRKLTKKGGQTFTTMKNLLVDPNSAERV